MSKKTEKLKTKTSDYKDLADYWTQNKENEDMATKWLVMLFPELASFRELLVKLDISLDDVFDYFYHLSLVKNHGYGNVSTTIFEGKITKIEGLIRTIKNKEIEAKGELDKKTNNVRNGGRLEKSSEP